MTARVWVKRMALLRKDRRECDEEERRKEEIEGKWEMK